jgi:hypothetical protein
MDFLRAGQAVKSRRPETKFWLAEATYSIFISTMQRYEFFKDYSRNILCLFVKSR